MHAPFFPWSTPILKPEELDKRIQELQTISFWLEQNLQGVKTLIQTLEVQKMAFSMLNRMNIAPDQLSQIWPHTAQASSAEEASPPSSSDTAPHDAHAGVQPNPAQWWATLMTQLSQATSQALKQVNPNPVSGSKLDQGLQTQTTNDKPKNKVPRRQPPKSKASRS
jgi:hypothetical protein